MRRNTLGRGQVSAILAPRLGAHPGPTAPIGRRAARSCESLQAASRKRPVLESASLERTVSRHLRTGRFAMHPLIASRPLLGMTSELGKVMAAARAREQAGHSVVHLERGEPNFDTPRHIVEALAEAARAGETHYPDARGSLPLREALVEKLGREN